MQKLAAVFNVPVFWRTVWNLSSIHTERAGYEV